MKSLISGFFKYLSELGLNSNVIKGIEITLIVLGILVLAWLADLITKKILLNLITRVIKKTKTEWDDLLIKRKVFHRLAHIAPAIVIYYFIDIAFGMSKGLVNVIQSGTYIYMIFGHY